MRTLLISLLLVARCALAQLDDVAFVGSLTSAASAPSYDPTYPTNISASPAILWFDVSKSGSYTTSSTPVLLDYAGRFNANATNLSASSTWPTRQPADQGGFDTLEFRATNARLETGGVTNWGKPIEIICVANWLKPTNSDPVAIWEGRASGSGSSFLRQGSAGVFQFYGGGSVISDGPITTNRWMVLDVYYSDTGSNWINGVLNSGGNVGYPDAWQGIRIGVNGSQHDSTVFKFAEMAIYTNKLSDSERNSWVQYATNKWGFAP